MSNGFYKEPNPQFEPITFVCDEFTNWASRCKSSGEFFQAALSDVRKAEMFVIFVSHARTLKGLGNAAGMADTRDASLLEIETLGRIDPESGKAVPRLEAMVKLPGQSLGDRTLVKLAKNSSPGVENSAPNSNSIAPERDYLERTYKLEFDWSKPEQAELSEPTSEPLNPSSDESFGDTEPKYTPLGLSREQALNLIKSLRGELNQTQIIERLWACKKGGSEAWKAAYAQFKELTGDTN